VVNVKEATRAAFSYFSGLYAANTSDVRLEEVELSEDEKNWLVTLSYLPGSSVQVALRGNTMPREYKVFRIDALTGEVKSMKIRKVE